MVSAVQCILMQYRCVYSGNVKLSATAASADFFSGFTALKTFVSLTVVFSWLIYESYCDVAGS